MSEIDSTEQWLRTNLEVEAAKSLRACRRHLADGLVDTYELKWAALAATSALQAFILKAYRSVDILYWTKKGREAMAAFEAGHRSSPPSIHDVFLPRFLDLCEKLRDDHGWAPDDATWLSIEFLSEVRNDFTHFRPKGTSILVPDLRRAIGAALEGVGYAIGRGSFPWYDAELERMARLELGVARRLTNAD